MKHCWKCSTAYTEDFILLRWESFPNLSINSIQSVSKFQLFFCISEQTDPTVYMKIQGILNSQINLEKNIEDFWEIFWCCTLIFLSSCFFVWCSLSFLDLWSYSFYHIWRVFAIFSYNIFVSLSETLWKFRDPYISSQLTVLFLYAFLLVFHLWFCFFLNCHASEFVNGFF